MNSSVTNNLLSIVFAPVDFFWLGPSTHGEEFADE